MRDPDEASIKAVRRFARLTGDLGALSDPDVRCIALHLMLENEAHGLAHVRSEPPPLVLSKHKHNKQTKQPGWDYVPDEDAWAELDAMNAEAERSAAEVAGRMASASLAEAPEKPPPLPATALLALEMKERLEKKRQKQRETEALLGEEGLGSALSVTNGETDEKNVDDDDGGWEQNVSRTTRVRRAKRAERQREAAAATKATIGVTNVADAVAETVSVSVSEKGAASENDAAAAEKARLAEFEAAADASAAFFRGDSSDPVTRDRPDAGEVEAAEASEDEASSPSEEDASSPFESTVVSATGDYAMQNVLLQMGLRLTTPDGVRVSELRRWVLRCHACGDVTKQTTRVFCAKCGNATLQKVQHTVGEGGAEQFGVRRKHKIRGTRFSLPAPKGGRREKAPILREDQLIGMRGVKKRDDEDVFAAEYNEESFAGSSRGQKPGAAHLYHQRDLVESGGFPKKNPNERRFVRTNRRRK